jgi:hypothetical protein
MTSWWGFGRKPLWPIFKQISQHLSGHIIGKEENLCMELSVFKPKIETHTFQKRRRRKRPLICVCLNQDFPPDRGFN